MLELHQNFFKYLRVSFEFNSTFSFQDFFSKCGQVHSYLRFSHMYKGYVFGKLGFICSIVPNENTFYEVQFCDIKNSLS